MPLGIRILEIFLYTRLAIAGLINATTETSYHAIASPGPVAWDIDGTVWKRRLYKGRGAPRPGAGTLPIASIRHPPTIHPPWPSSVGLRAFGPGVAPLQLRKSGVAQRGMRMHVRTAREANQQGRAPAVRAIQHCGRAAPACLFTETPP